jgi:RNA polymerase-binding transcription factor DksA
MATKKALPKKAAKAAKPAKPTGGKASAPKKAVKPAAKKAAAKPAPKKAAAKKSVPAKQAAKPVAKPAPKKTGNAAAPKKAPVAINKKAAEPVKNAVAAKPVPSKQVPVKPAPAKQVETVTKPSVAAPTREEVKPAIQPRAKPLIKKEPPKPVKVVIPKTTTTKAVKYEPDFTKSVLDSKNNNKDNTGPTMRYSDAELAEFRELINKKLDTAKKELAYLQGLITRKDEGGDLDEGRYMTMEDGSMSMEREQLSQMASRQIQFIDHLEKANMRIENKTYGICRVTGKLIDKARLRAVPHATLSIEAKQMMNK